MASCELPQWKNLLQKVLSEKTQDFLNMEFAFKYGIKELMRHKQNF